MPSSSIREDREKERKKTQQSVSSECVLCSNKVRILQLSVAWIFASLKCNCEEILNLSRMNSLQHEKSICSCYHIKSNQDFHFTWQSKNTSHTKTNSFISGCKKSWWLTRAKKCNKFSSFLQWIESFWIQWDW